MKPVGQWLALLAGRQDVVLALLLLVAVFMMIIPLPTALVDVLIAINLMFSIILLMIAIYLRDPLDFSVFPSVLLITTLYRLALTISTSRLILLQHDAGEIVYTFGNFAVGGNLVVGVIVFAIITIVQFIVITKGSERVAEVSARFSLDGMPGKQMSIDGDMRAGIIDANEARRQRRLVQKESQLYGAMDGAMKFVKGDAIASIIVILVNIIGGILVGVFMHEMSAAHAVSTYAILSIGDGLIAQIPALLISITAGIIVTRVPGEQRQNLASELTEQIGRQPLALWIAAGVLLIFALIPGFPALDFTLLAALVSGCAWAVRRRGRTVAQAPGGEASAQTEAGAGEMTPGAVPLKVKLSDDLNRPDKVVPLLDELRRRKFEQLGVPLPEIHLQRDGSLEPQTLQVLLYQEVVLNVTLPSGMVLVDVHAGSVAQAVRVEALPFGGMKLQWVEEGASEALVALGVGVYHDEMRIIHCLSLLIDRYASEFIGVQETRFLMDAMERRYGELVKELQRQLPIGRIADVLQRLVEENISIRDLRSVFEALIEWAPKEKDPVMLTEYVRLGLRRHIVGRHRQGRPWISAWMIGDQIEGMIRESIRQTAAGTYSALEQKQSQAILERIRTTVGNAEGRQLVLLTAIDVRRFLRKIVERELFSVPVLSFQELGEEAELKVMGNIDFVGEG